jgi:hypothetical protein
VTLAFVVRPADWGFPAVTRLAAPFFATGALAGAPLDGLPLPGAGLVETVVLAFVPAVGLGRKEAFALAGEPVAGGFRPVDGRALALEPALAATFGR